MNARITADWQIDEVLRRFPATGPIFLQHGRMLEAGPRPDASLQDLHRYRASFGLKLPRLQALAHRGADNPVPFLGFG
jgi:hypothetical protein